MRWLRMPPPGPPPRNSLRGRQATLTGRQIDKAVKGDLRIMQMNEFATDANAPSFTWRQTFEGSILGEDMSVFERNAEMMVAEMDGDLVMMDVDLGTYFAINPVGGHIWTQLETGQTLDQLITSVQASFASDDTAQITADVEAFLADLTEHKLIRSVDAA